MTRCGSKCAKKDGRNSKRSVKNKKPKRKKAHQGSDEQWPSRILKADVSLSDALLGRRPTVATVGTAATETTVKSRNTTQSQTSLSQTLKEAQGRRCVAF